jgi:hypothetical protein
MKSFKQYTAEEGAPPPTNATGPAVDMNPTGRRSKKPFAKMFDRRSRYDTQKLFKRANDK